MTLFNSSELKQWGSLITRSYNKAADVILKESFSAYKSTSEYDIFLSHSYKDKEVILGLKGFIESLGYSVYIDWVVDTQLDRTFVSRETAKLLKDRMKSCKCLFYAFSMNSPNSVWMPWELGLFDGIKGKAAVLPINDSGFVQNEFKGQEYLELYPYIDKGNDNTGKMRLWICVDSIAYVTFDAWLRD
jgi:hypothetical protein